MPGSFVRAIFRRSVVAALLLSSALPHSAAQAPVVQTAAAQTPASDANIFDARAATLVGRFHAASSAPEQASLLNQVYDLRELVADRPALARFFAQTAADQSLPAPVRDAVREYSAGTAVAPGLISQAGAPKPRRAQRGASCETLQKAARLFAKSARYDKARALEDGLKDCGPRTLAYSDALSERGEHALAVTVLRWRPRPPRAVFPAGPSSSCSTTVPSG